MANIEQLQMDFVNMRFGMFIHFNSATFQFNTGDMVDWEYGHENHGRPRRFPFNPRDWNPDKLDCKQWAKAAKSAKMEFSALTTKHHEGFDLWPSKMTEHCVRNATNTTDVVAEYLSAYRSEGIKAGLYFSMLDIAHGIGKAKCTKDDVELIKGQLRELLTWYGDIPFIIIDGWQAHWGGPSYENLPFGEVDALVKSLQPDCLLMNISCENNLDHTDIVFYESAAGQKIDEDFNGPGASCNHLTGQWFWRADDPLRKLRTAEWVMETIKTSNERNVSFILNASPNVNGLIDDNVIEIYREVGELYQKIDPVLGIPDGFKRIDRK